MPGHPTRSVLLSLLSFICLLPHLLVCYKQSDCTFPFKYNGVRYHYCTKNSYNIAWCSIDPVYKGRWAVCGPEVPKEIVNKLKLTAEEVGKQKAKLAADERNLTELRLELSRIRQGNEIRSSNDSAAMMALRQQLQLLTVRHQALEQREQSQESLQPIIIGLLSTVSVLAVILSVLLYVSHCRCGDFLRNKSSQDEQQQQQQPDEDAASAADAESLAGASSVSDRSLERQSASARQAKRFPGHFYHLTVDEDEDDDEGEGEEDTAIAHSEAAAALAATEEESASGRK